MNDELTPDTSHLAPRTCTYELVIPKWRCAVPADWKLEFTNSSGEWLAAAERQIVLMAGDRLRGNGGPEEEQLRAMLEAGYVKEIGSSSD